MVRSLLLLALAAASSGCSLKTYAVNMVGDALASGDSVYESDDDIDLVVSALPFGLKLTESLLAQSPHHRGLLLTASRGFVLYTYADVHYRADVAAETDLDRAALLRSRSRRLYLRAFGYGLRALEDRYPGFGRALAAAPDRAVEAIPLKDAADAVPLLYWSAAALGLAISISADDAAMLARLPEVAALLDRALALDADWQQGSLHAFKVIFAGARPAVSRDVDALTRHYERALTLSNGGSAGLHVAYAEAVALPAQDGPQFRALVEKALAVDPDSQPKDRLATLVAQRRAAWLLARIDDLIPPRSGGTK